MPESQVGTAPPRRTGPGGLLLPRRVPARQLAGAPARREGPGGRQRQHARLRPALPVDRRAGRDASRGAAVHAVRLPPGDGRGSVRRQPRPRTADPQRVRNHARGRPGCNRRLARDLQRRAEQYGGGERERSRQSVDADTARRVQRGRAPRRHDGWACLRTPDARAPPRAGRRGGPAGRRMVRRRHPAVGVRTAAPRRPRRIRWVGLCRRRRIGGFRCAGWSSCSA